MYISTAICTVAPRYCRPHSPPPSRSAQTRPMEQGCCWQLSRVSKSDPAWVSVCAATPSSSTAGIPAAFLRSARWPRIELVSRRAVFFRDRSSRHSAAGCSRRNTVHGHTMTPARRAKRLYAALRAAGVLRDRKRIEEKYGGSALPLRTARSVRSPPQLTVGRAREPCSYDQRTPAMVPSPAVMRLAN